MTVTPDPAGEALQAATRGKMVQSPRIRAKTVGGSPFSAMNKPIPSPVLQARGRAAMGEVMAGVAKHAAVTGMEGEPPERKKVTGLKQPRLATPRLNPELSGVKLPSNPYRVNWKKLGPENGVLQKMGNVEHARPGDVIVMTGEKGKPLKGISRVGNAAWEAIAPKVQGNIVHAGIISPDGQHIIHSQANKGVVKVPFHEAVEGRRYAIRRPHLVSEDVRHQAAHFAEQQIGKKYSWKDFGTEFAGALVPESVTKHFNSLAGAHKAHEGYSCSSLLTAAYDGKHLGPLHRAGTPADLHYTPHMETIWHNNHEVAHPVAGRLARLAGRVGALTPAQKKRAALVGAGIVGTGVLGTLGTAAAIAVPLGVHHHRKKLQAQMAASKHHGVLQKAASLLSTKIGSTQKPQPGDVIVMSAVKTPKELHGISRIGNNIWRSASPRIQGGLTHAAIVTHGGGVVQARAGDGVVHESFKDAVKDRDYIIRRPHGSAAHRHNAATWAKKQVGKGYSWGDFAAQTAGALGGSHAAHGIESALGAPRNREGYTCSSLITAAYGKRHLGDLDRAATPADLGFSKRMKTIVNRSKQTAQPTFGRLGDAAREMRRQVAPKKQKQDPLLSHVIMKHGSAAQAADDAIKAVLNQTRQLHPKLQRALVAGIVGVPVVYTLKGIKDQARDPQVSGVHLGAGARTAQRVLEPTSNFARAEWQRRHPPRE